MCKEGCADGLGLPSLNSVSYIARQEGPLLFTFHSAAINELEHTMYLTRMVEESIVCVFQIVHLCYQFPIHWRNLVHFFKNICVFELNNSSERSAL